MTQMMKLCQWEYCFQPHKNLKKNKIEFFGGHIWVSHIIPLGTLAIMGPPSFWDISYLTRAAGLVEDRIDICAINETWFNESEDSKRRLAEVKAILKKAGYIILNTDRPRRGRGVGIICRQNLQINQLDGLVLDALEMGLWKLTIANKTVHIMGIYHPPKCISNTSTMNLFFEELSDYLTENINKYEELIILDDTSIHYDLKTDHDTIAFEELYTPLGFNNL